MPPKAQNANPVKQACDRACRRIAASLSSGDWEAAHAELQQVAHIGKGALNRSFFLTLINRCAEAGAPAAAAWCVEAMERVGCYKLNVATFNAVIHACAKGRRLDLAGDWWERMTSTGVKPNAITYNTMIHACAQARQAWKAEWWLQQMELQGLKPCIVSFGSVIDSFAKIGNIRKAEEWMQHMHPVGLKADALVFNSLINACAKSGSYLKAEAWLLEMESHSFAADQKTYNSLISACAKAGARLRAEHWFHQLETHGYAPDTVTFGALMHADVKVGDIAKAESWLDQMLRQDVAPNLVCFNTLLSACAQWGDHTRALQLWERMTALGFKPNAISYNSIVCAHAAFGEREKVQEWLVYMVRDSLHPDHTTCSMLARRYQQARILSLSPEEAFRGACEDIVRVYRGMGNETKVQYWIKELARAGFPVSQDLCRSVNPRISAKTPSDVSKGAPSEGWHAATHEKEVAKQAVRLQNLRELGGRRRGPRNRGRQEARSGLGEVRDARNLQACAQQEPEVLEESLPEPVSVLASELPLSLVTSILAWQGTESTELTWHAALQIQRVQL